MRLTDRQRSLALGLLRDRFGNDARVILFGSRVDDHHRGGDVDLYVETDRSVDVVARLMPVAAAPGTRSGVRFGGLSMARLKLSEDFHAPTTDDDPLGS